MIIMTMMLVQAARMRRKTLNRIAAAEQYAERRERYESLWDCDQLTSTQEAPSEDPLAIQHYHLLSCLEHCTVT